MMFRPFACALAVALIGGAALTQPAPPVEQVPGAGDTPDRRPPDRGKRPDAQRERGPQLFMSPSGEPFRGEDGLGQWFARVDADHDGAIDLAEFRADARAFFDRLDTNHDGVVDGFEIQAYEANVAPEIARYDFDNPQYSNGQPPGGGSRGGMGGGGGHRGGGGGGRRGGGGQGQQQQQQSSGDQPQRPSAQGREGAARWSMINEPEPVSGADEDVNGRVSLAEWMKATDRRFETLDKAETGKLTLEQLKPLLPRQGGARRGR
jgi:EF hand